MLDPTTSTPPARVLVVEDEGLIASQIARQLTDLGYAISEVVSTGPAAIESAAQRPPDVVLMDINLTKAMSGIEAATRIRAQCDVPIVYLTAYSEEMVMDRIKPTEPYGFLTKPVRSHELDATIQMALYKHRMEARLRESEERYRLLAENVGDVIWQMNETLDRYTYVSPSVTRLLGYTPDEMMAMPIDVHFVPADQARMREAVAGRLAAEAEGRGDDETRIWELRGVRPDGSTVWIESTTHPVRDEEGAFQGLAGVSRDISARKAAQEALHRVRYSIDQVTDSVLWVNENGEFIDVNDAACRNLGYTRQELLHMKVADVDPNYPAEAWASHWQEMVQRGTMRIETVHQTKRGERIPVEAIVHPQQFGGTRYNCVVVRDIRARKAAEEKLRQSEERYRLLFEHAGIGIGYYTVDGRLLSLNDMAAQHLGGRPEDLVGQSMCDMFGEEAGAIYMERIRNAVERKAGQEYQDRVPLPDRVAWFNSTYTAVQDAPGHTIGVQITSHDITERKQAEEALRESETRLRRLIESTNDLIFLQDLEGRYLYYNGPSRYGLERDDVLGTTPGDWFPADTAAHMLDKVRQVAADGEGRTIEQRIEWKGETLWFLDHMFPIYDEGENIVAIGTISRDITARKQAQEALRESQERLALALHGAELGTWDWHVPTGKALFDERWAGMLGHTVDDIAPRFDAWKKRVHPEDMPQVMQTLDDHLQGCTPLYQTEHRLRTKSGEWKWILSTGKVVERDEQDRAVRAVGTHRDITAQKRVEQAVADERARLNTILSALDTGLSLINPDLTIAWVNDKVREMFPGGDPIGQICHAFYEGLDAPCEHCGTLKAFETGEIQRRERFNPATERWYAILSQPVADEGGQITGVLEGITDITERKEAEQALRESEQQYRRLLNALQEGVWAIDADRRTTYVNPRMAEMLGYTPQEMLGQPLFAFMDEQGVELAQRLLARRQEGINEQHEFEFMHKSGRRLYVLLEAAPILDQDDRYCGAIAGVIDITARVEAQQALRALTAQFESLLENAPALIALFDREGRYHLINQATTEVLQLPQEQVVGRTFADLLPAEAAAIFGERIQTLVETDETLTVEDRLWVAGEERVYQTILFPIRETPDLFGSVALDVTDRVQAEEALRESEWRLDQMLQTMVDGMVRVDVEGQITFANPAAEQILEIARDEIEGRYYQEYEWQQIDEQGNPFPPDLLPLAQALGKRQAVQGIEHGIRATSGRTKWLSVNAAPLVRDDGEVYGAVASFRDVTERKQAEEALRQYAERLQILHQIDAEILAAESPDAIARAALTRLQDLIVYQWASISEIDPVRQRGRDVVVLSGDDQEPPLSPTVWYPLINASNIIDTTRQGQAHLVQDLSALEILSPIEHVVRKAGARAYVSVPLIVQDDLVGTLNLALDRAHAFRAEHVEILNEIAASLSIAMQQATLLAQTQEDAETKTLLLHEVNHRVMNNMTMILSILELEIEQIQAYGPERELEAVLQDVRSRVQGIATVHRMLSHAQEDALDPGQVVFKIIDAALSSSPIQDQVEIFLDAPDHMPPLPAKRAVTLALVINELTTNSVKYAFADRTRGQIRVRIEQVETEAAPPGVRLVFQDDGPGWPDEVLAGERQSMGLWLIQASVTHNLGGEIAWYNEDGAVVEIQFPIRA